jgi:MFS family permease
MSDRKRSIFGVVFLTIFLDMVGFSIIFPLFPDMLDHYLFLEQSMGGGIISRFVSWVGEFGHDLLPGNPNFRLETVIFGGILGSLYAILQFFFAPIWGGLSDRYGRRPVLMITLCDTAIGYFLWIMAGDIWVLLLSRVIGGMAGGNISVATAAIADVTTREKRSKGMAFVGIAFGLGFVLGPALGGLASQWDWSGSELVFFGMHPFSAAATISFGLAVINLLWLFWGFSETLPVEKRNPTNSFLPAFCKMTKVTSPEARRTCLCYLLYMISFSGMEFTLTFLAVERFAFSPQDLGEMFLLIGGTLILVQGVVVRRFVGRIGERNMAHLGIFTGVFAFLVISFSHSFSWFYPGLFLMSTGVALISPTLTALTSLSSSESEQGVNLGIFRSCGSIARSIGPLSAGLIYFTCGSSIAYLIGAVWLIFPALVLFGVKQSSGSRGLASAN